MKTFEEILNSINAVNRDTFPELTLVDTSSFSDFDTKYNIYVYAFGYRYISVKTRDHEEGKDDASCVVMEAFKSIDSETKEVSYDEDMSVEGGKFYRIVKDTTIQSRRNTPGGGYSSSPMKVPAGAVFKGSNPSTSFEVYDGMPVKETKHNILIEGIDLFQSDNQYLVNAYVGSLDNQTFSEITEEEYEEASKKFRDRPRYKPGKGKFVNFLAR